MSTLAEQLTLSDIRMFRSILPKDIIHYVRKEKHMSPVIRWVACMWRVLFELIVVSFQSNHPIVQYAVQMGHVNFGDGTWHSYAARNAEAPLGSIQRSSVFRKSAIGERCSNRDSEHRTAQWKESIALGHAKDLQQRRDFAAEANSASHSPWQREGVHSVRWMLFRWPSTDQQHSPTAGNGISFTFLSLHFTFDVFFRSDFFH